MSSDDVLPDTEERHEQAATCSSAHLVSVMEVVACFGVSRWKEKHRAGWDATVGRNGGSERTVWETLFTMDGFDGSRNEGAITLVLHLASALERVSLPIVWAWLMYFDFTKKNLHVLCDCSEHLRRVQFEGRRSRPSWPSSLGQSGVACSFAVCFKMY